MQNILSDTIAAIATPPGYGGIGIVRVSGPDAFAIVLPLLRRPGGDTSLPPSHTLTYAQIVAPDTHEILDETLVAFMRAPHTYTCEDVVDVFRGMAARSFYSVLCAWCWPVERAWLIPAS